MALPFILYHNLMDETGATLTASSTASGYDVNNLKDRNSFTYWKSTGGASEWIKIDLGGVSTLYPDAFGMTGHNLYTQTAGLTFEYSDDDISYATGAYSLAITPAKMRTDSTMVSALVTTGGTWTSGHRYWRVSFSGCDAAIQIGAFCIGRRLDLYTYMDEGFDPTSIQLVSRQARSRGGTYVGQVVDHVKQTVKLDVGPAGYATSWMDEDSDTLPSWGQFMHRYWSKGRPFWFRWGGELEGTATRWMRGWYCSPPAGAKSAAPFVSSTTRTWKFEFDVMADQYGI